MMLRTLCVHEPRATYTATTDLLCQSARESAIDQLHAATAIYTRDSVVSQLLDQIEWPVGEGALLDTSCGDGSFLGLALTRLLTSYPHLSAEEIISRVVGWEIHFFAAHEARSRLRSILIEFGRSPAEAAAVSERIVRCGDFLMEGPRERIFRWIVGNPPYLRMLNVPEPLRGDYERSLPTHARADLLHSFLDRCCSLLLPDGEFAAVTSDRWTMGEQCARLREIVGQHFGLAHLERLDPRSAFYRPKLRRAGTPPRIHPIAIILKARTAPGVIPLTRAPIYPGAQSHSASHTRTLGELAHVRLAPWLGTYGIFLVDAHVAHALPPEAVVPAVDTDDIRGGELASTPRSYAVRTQPDCAPPAAVMAHLDRELPRMCARGRSRVRWMPPEPFHKFDLDQPSLVVPRIAKSLRPVRVPAGMLPVNHNLSIVRAGALSLDDIESVLMSADANDWMRTHAAPLENGYFSLTTRVLRELPVP